MATILLIGRFQPFHKGHLFLARALSRRNKNSLKIAIGSTNKRDEKNPFPFRARKRMVSLALGGAGVRKNTVFGIPDQRDDLKWLAALIRTCGPFDYCVSGNPVVMGIFRSAGLDVRTHPFLRKRYYNGTKIRLLLGKEDIRNRVPPEIMEVHEIGRLVRTR